MTKYALMAALDYACIAYQQQQPLCMQPLFTIDNRETDVQCYIRRSRDRLIITFRGSNSSKDWRTNLTFWKKTIPYDNTSSKIRGHTGFLNAYKAPGVRDALHAFMDDGVCHVTVTGHSLGAALAVLCAVDLQYNFPEKDYEVFLFGCPRVGNRAFQKSYNKRVFKTMRVENGNDIVTKVPPAILGYRHVGIRIHTGPPRIPLFVWPEDHRQQRYYQNLFLLLKP